MTTEKILIPISEQLLDEAIAEYNQLKLNYTYPDSGNYWPLGCILDSIIDTLNITCAKGIMNYMDAQTFLESVADSYINNTAQGVWYDDWGWWAIATAKIYDPEYSLLFHDAALKGKFEQILQETFKFMVTGEYDGTLKHISNPQDYKGTMNAYDYVVTMAAHHPQSDWGIIKNYAGPKWNVGCWQAPMSPSSNPLSSDLGPFQDSVINGLFYIAIQRTLNQTGLGTQQQVDDMGLFYQHWMADPSLTSEQKIFMQINEQAGLFRERIGVYANGTVPLAFNPNLAWMGDQGLMLNALTQLYKRQSGPAQEATLNIIKQVIMGVFSYGVGDLPGMKDVVFPWVNVGTPLNEQPGNPPGYIATGPYEGHGDYGDYFSGVGIFMRGLLEAVSIPEILQMTGSLQIQSVMSNTVAAMKSGNYMEEFFTRCNQFPPNAPLSFFDGFNKMATYTAASVIINA